MTIHRIAVILASIIPTNDLRVWKSPAPKSGMSIVDPGVTYGYGHTRAVIPLPYRGSIHQGYSLRQMRLEDPIRVDGDNFWDSRQFFQALQSDFSREPENIYEPFRNVKLIGIQTIDNLILRSLHRVFQVLPKIRVLKRFLLEV